MQVGAHIKKHWKVHLGWIIVLLILLLVAFFAGVFAGSKYTTIQVGSSPPVQVPKAAISQASQGLETHKGARDEFPSGVTRAQYEAGKKQQEALAHSDQLPIVQPDAAPTQRGCTSFFVRNYSSRQGVAPRILTLHYTVSPNRVGWSDVLAVVNEFNTVAFQASSNYVIDNEGHCSYIVREPDKAWTQAGFNPFAISVEVVNSGKEPTYAGAAGLKKIAMVFSDAATRWHIPVRLGAVSGCRVVRSGIVDHAMLGACDGGHHDIHPYSVAKVITAIQQFRSTQSDLTKAQRRIAYRRQILAMRAAGKTWAEIKLTSIWKAYVALGGK